MTLSRRSLLKALGLGGAGMTGGEPRDMPLVRAIARDTLKDGGKFSAMVLSVVKSQPFQMNMRTTPSEALTTASARPHTNDKGNN